MPQFLVILLALMVENGFASFHNPLSLSPSLDTVDEFLGSPPFPLAFQDGDQVHTSTSDCIGTNRNCPSSTNMRVEVKVLASDQVEINQWGANGAIKARHRVTEREWDTSSRNYLRAKIAQIESFGFRITLSHLVPVPCPPASYLTERDQCLKVDLFGVNSLNHRTDYTFWLWKTTIGAAQIIAYTQTDSFPFQRTIRYQLTQVLRPQGYQP